MTPPQSNRAGVLIVGHGERGGGRGDNAALLALGTDVGCSLKGLGVAVEVAVLNGEPSLTEAMASLATTGCARLVVYPFFMSDGYFTRTRLPQALEAVCHVPWHTLPPFGVDQNLPRLIEQRALAGAEGKPVPARNARLLIVAHGSSKSPASAVATEAIATAIRCGGAFGQVETAFLEETPYLAEKLQSAFFSTIVIGAFIGDGLHANEDVVSAVSDTPHLYLGAVGTWPEISALVTGSLKGVLGARSPTTNKRLG